MTKTYFLPPDFDAPPPPDGPIRLGNIISKPLDPFYTLNSNNPATPLSSLTYTTPKTSFRATRNKMRSGEAGVWVKVLESFDFKMVGKYEKCAEDLFVVDRIETEFFVPSREYLMDSVGVKGVGDFLKAGRWKKLDVFIITGIKVARGAKIVLGKKKEVGGDVSAGIDVNPAGVNVKVGLKAGVKATEDESTEFEGDSFILAYQVRKIICKKGKVLGSEEYSDGAVLGDEVLEDRVRVEIESFAEDEATAADVKEVADTFPFLEWEEEDSVVVIPRDRFGNRVC
jgi:hypothetical protein